VCDRGAYKTRGRRRWDRGELRRRRSKSKGKREHGTGQWMGREWEGEGGRSTWQARRPAGLSGPWGEITWIMAGHRPHRHRNGREHALPHRHFSSFAPPVSDSASPPCSDRPVSVLSSGLPLLGAPAALSPLKASRGGREWQSVPGRRAQGRPPLLPGGWLRRARLFSLSHASLLFRESTGICLCCSPREEKNEAKTNEN
jgi:hypothetical protein